MLLLAAAAVVGGLALVAVLWQYVALLALAGAPLGGSFSALIAGLVLAFRRARAERKRRRSVRLFRKTLGQHLKPAWVRVSPARSRDPMS